MDYGSQFTPFVRAGVGKNALFNVILEVYVAPQYMPQVLGTIVLFNR
jgi:hypothetical protein